MTSPITYLTLLSIFLTGCSAAPHPVSESNTLIDYEHSGTYSELTRDSYRMRDLICALSNLFWEISPPDRGAYVTQWCPDGVPEDFVKVHGSGAQCGITALRLDKDELAVVGSTSMGGDDFRVLKRIPGGWIDLTSQAFPRPLVRTDRVEARADQSMVVHHADGSMQTYVWRESKFVEA